MPANADTIPLPEDYKPKFDFQMDQERYAMPSLEIDQSIIKHSRDILASWPVPEITEESWTNKE